LKQPDLRKIFMTQMPDVKREIPGSSGDRSTHTSQHPSGPGPRLRRWATQIRLNLDFDDITDSQKQLLDENRGTFDMSTHDYIIALSIAYVFGSFIFCRSFIGVLGDAITDDDKMNVDKTQFSTLLLTAGLGFAIGKVFTGPIVDLLDARMSWYGLCVLSAGCTFVFGLMQNFEGLLLFALLNGIIQSAGWSVLTKLIYQWYVPNQYGTAFAFLSIGSRAGSFLTSVILGSLLSVYSWRTAVMFSPAICIFSIFASFPIFYSNDRSNECTTYKDKKQVEIEKRLDDQNEPEFVDASFSAVYTKFYRILTNARFWYVSLAVAGLNPITVFEGYTSLYIGDLLDVSPSTSGIVSGSIPLGFVFSLIFSISYIETYSEVYKAIYVTISTIIVLILSIALFIFTWIVETQSSPNKAIGVAVSSLLLFSAGFFTGYPYFVPGGVFNVKFGGKDSATVSSLHDVVSSFFSSIFVYVAGYISNDHGWRYVWPYTLVLITMSIFCWIKYYNLNLKHELKEVSFYTALLQAIQGKMEMVGIDVTDKIAE